ncbi:MAG: hypothetical protein KC731_04780 [Myxococcales bacterium]|nr:hypothetical protein [Myxococcales bacterium]
MKQITIYGALLLTLATTGCAADVSDPDTAGLGLDEQTVDSYETYEKLKSYAGEGQDLQLDPETCAHTVDIAFRGARDAEGDSVYTTFKTDCAPGDITLDLVLVNAAYAPGAGNIYGRLLTGAGDSGMEGEFYPSEDGSWQWVMGGAQAGKKEIEAYFRGIIEAPATAEDAPRLIGFVAFPKDAAH